MPAGIITAKTLHIGVKTLFNLETHIPACFSVAQSGPLFFLIQETESLPRYSIDCYTEHSYILMERLHTRLKC